MALYKPWLKMWVSWLNDPNIGQLGFAQKGAWWSLYTLAHTCGADGRLVNNNGRGLTIDELHKALHMGDPGDARIFSTMITKMLDAGSLVWDNDTLVITHYAQDQKATPTSTKEAVAERVRKYRERQRQEQLPLEPPKDKESSGVPITTTEVEGNAVTSVTPQGEKGGVQAQGVTEKPLPLGRTRAGQGREKVGTSPGDVTEKPLQNDPIIAEICRLYEENIGELPHGGVVIEDMTEFAQNFRGDIKWIKLAFKEALGRNKRRWQYIRTILERWQEEGGPDGKAGQELERGERARESAGRSGPSADRADPLEATRRGGWKLKRSGPAQPGSGGQKR